MNGTQNHAPWRKLMLIPFWITQLIALLLSVGVEAFSLRITIYEDDMYDAGDYFSQSYYFSGFYIAASAICICIVVTEIVFLARFRLLPKIFLILNIFKTLIWTGLIVYDIVIDVQSQTVFVFGNTVDLIVYVVFIVQLVYAIVIFHRRSRAVSDKSIELEETYAQGSQVHYQPAHESQAEQPQSNREIATTNSLEASYHSASTTALSLHDFDASIHSGADDEKHYDRNRIDAAPQYDGPSESYRSEKVLVNGQESAYGDGYTDVPQGTSVVYETTKSTRDLKG